MVPWNRLPHDVQRVLLVLAVAASGTTSASCCFPRVCDPAPPPKVSPTPTWPRVCDPPPPPPRTATPGITVTATSTVTPTRTITPTLTITPGASRSATPPPVICDPPPPPARVTPNTLAPNALPGAVLLPLPLAELRSVEVTWTGGLTFGASTPWTGARYRWSASGGSLVTDGERAAWQPPAEAGRYLVQVAADWGRDGLAVDALVLVVADDGNVSFG